MRAHRSLLPLAFVGLTLVGCGRREKRRFDEDFFRLRAVSMLSTGIPADQHEQALLRETFHRALGYAQKRSGRAPQDVDWLWRKGELERIGHLLGGQGMAEQAQHDLHSVLAQDSAFRAAHLSLGWLHLGDGVGGAADAQREFQAAMEGAVSVEPDAYKGLFLSYYYQGRWADALTAGEAYLSRRPDDSDFRKMQAMAATNVTVQKNSAHR